MKISISQELKLLSKTEGSVADIKRKIEEESSKVDEIQARIESYRDSLRDGPSGNWEVARKILLLQRSMQGAIKKQVRATGFAEFDYSSAIAKMAFCEISEDTVNIQGDRIFFYGKAAGGPKGTISIPTKYLTMPTGSVLKELRAEIKEQATSHHLANLDRAKRNLDMYSRRFTEIEDSIGHTKRAIVAIETKLNSMN